MIELAGVSVGYDDSTAVDDFTLSVPDGSWLALIGPNGAGKSSLLRAVAGLVASTGVVRVDGRELGGLSRRGIAKLIAYVPQTPEFPADMRVADYVLLGRTAHLGFLQSESERDLRVCDELLDRLALGHLAERRLATLSGGERQRLSLARALAQEATVLLLDEPTSALDLGRRVAALELVDELRAERGLTVLSAIHDLTLAGQFADLLALMSRGRLLAHGTPTAVLTQALLAPVFGVAIGVGYDEGAPVVVPRRLSRRAAC